jgi:hypothetical protein
LATSIADIAGAAGGSLAHKEVRSSDNVPMYAATRNIHGIGSKDSNDDTADELRITDPAVPGFMLDVPPPHSAVTKRLRKLSGGPQ